MASSSTVAANGDDPAAPDDFYGWDWSSTTHDGSKGCVDEILHLLGAKNVVPGKGLQGCSQSVKAFDADGYAIGSVYFGGGRDDVHVVSTSCVADVARPLVAGYGNAKTARVDTRVDTLLSWDELHDVLTQAAETYGAQIMFMEAKERGVSKGRTLYLGAPTSRIRVRVYEKWLESPDEYVWGTNRVEVQLRPHSSVKADVSAWTPGETFCASRTTRDLAARLGHSYMPEASLRLKKKKPTLEETLGSMAKQYGNAVARFLEQSGGDIGRVMSYLTDVDDHAMTPVHGNGVPNGWGDRPARLDFSGDVPF